MKMSASITNRYKFHKADVRTENITKAMTIEPKSSGFGSSVNGGELLLLALATCFCNDLYREAQKKNISIEEVKVECIGEFGGEGDAGYNFQYNAEVKSDASVDVIEELIKYTDSVAEIQKTLRRGLDIVLTVAK